MKPLGEESREPREDDPDHDRDRGDERRQHLERSWETGEHRVQHEVQEQDQGIEPQEDQGRGLVAGRKSGRSSTGKREPALHTGESQHLLAADVDRLELRKPALPFRGAKPQLQVLGRIELRDRYVLVTTLGGAEDRRSLVSREARGSPGDAGEPLLVLDLETRSNLAGEDRGDGNERWYLRSPLLHRSGRVTDSQESCRSRL